MTIILELRIDKMMPATNWRFGATAAVAPQKRQCEIERLSPA